ncbi:MAG: hypothetical protein RBG13Loki_1772 [Promethearchaeota archaeon CR_4]|nr:MAG: hypothetical protein RBG13Loki_1772 [Candidatus Lokiarchaeota archaeon CR_4]
MNSFPQYLLRRLIPPDAVRLVGGKIEVTVINVLMPVTIEHFPDEDFARYVDIVVDGVPLQGEQKRDFSYQLEAHFENNVINVTRAKEHDGLVIPLGGVVKLIAPNIWHWNVGETHTIYVRIYDDPPIEVTVECKVSQ